MHCTSLFLNGLKSLLVTVKPKVLDYQFVHHYFKWTEKSFDHLQFFDVIFHTLAHQESYARLHAELCCAINDVRLVPNSNVHDLCHEYFSTYIFYYICYSSVKLQISFWSCHYFWGFLATADGKYAWHVYAGKKTDQTNPQPGI